MSLILVAIYILKIFKLNKKGLFSSGPVRISEIKEGHQSAFFPPHWIFFFQNLFSLAASRIAPRNAHMLYTLPGVKFAFLI